jgi:hypothetical protein
MVLETPFLPCTLMSIHSKRSIPHLIFKDLVLFPLHGGNALLFVLFKSLSMTGYIFEKQQSDFKLY